jgi:effector-binding domain-containing protein
MKIVICMGNRNQYANTLFMKLHIKFAFTFFFSLIFILFSCKDDKQKSAIDKSTIIVKSDKLRSKNDTTPRSVPIINISDTMEFPNIVLCIKDSAINNVRLSQKLAKIYGIKLAEFIKKNKLKVTGPPMAWYKTQKAPFFFEAGIPIDKKPKKLPKGFIIKQTGGGARAIVAHYFGPYEETPQGYAVLKEWITDEHKSIAAAPYEIYVSDPIGKDGQPIDPYKVQTDIVYPYR